MRRNAIQVAHLVDGSPQRNQHQRVLTRGRAPRIADNQEIQLRLDTQTTENSLGSESRITSAEPARPLQQAVGGVSAFRHCAQNIEGGATCGRN